MRLPAWHAGLAPRPRHMLDLERVLGADTLCAIDRGCCAQTGRQAGRPALQRGSGPSPACKHCMHRTVLLLCQQSGRDQVRGCRAAGPPDDLLCPGSRVGAGVLPPFHSRAIATGRVQGQEGGGTPPGRRGDGECGGQEVGVGAGGKDVDGADLEDGPEIVHTTAGAGSCDLDARTGAGRRLDAEPKTCEA